ncbi:ulp1 protease family, C-terminal catalytic domain-containing protein, partial [Tanacetum coccineum]
MDNTNGIEVGKKESVKKESIKKSKGVGTKTYKFQTRNSPRAFFNAISKLSPVQKSCLEQLGFGKLIHFKVEGIPSKLGFYVVNNFDETTMEIKLENASLLITMETIADMIGIINKGVDILVEDVVKDVEMIKNWEDYWKKKTTYNNVDKRVAERALAEIKSGGLGKGPYVEEQDDPIPDNLEGFIWKLNNYVVCINKERCGFERTFDVAKEMFPGNTMFAELEKRFIESLQYQQEENAEIGRASVHTEDETMASEGQEQSMKAGDRTCSRLDSPRYHLGPQTQAIIFETADKLYKEFERKKLFNFSDKLSFSLGLTQDEYDMGPETHKEVANTSEKGVEAFSSGKSESSFSIDREENRVKARQDPLEVVPLNFFSPTNEVMVHGRRAVTLTDRMKSPFFIRVVNADKVESGEEKRLAKILFKKMAGDVSDVLFETKYGHQSSRGQIETLGPQEPVDDNILSSWSAYLNFLEAKKDSMSPARLFFPTFEVDKKLFACDNGYTLEMFMEYAESASSSYGGQTKLDKADIVFIPVSNGEHKFLVCVNLKNPAVTLIDSKKEGNKVTRKKKKDGNIDDVIVASKLHQFFGQYLYASNHGKAAAILECQVVR